MTTEFKYAIEKFEMYGKDSQPGSLVQIGNINSIDISGFSPEEIIAIETANTYGAHYIYLRKFDKRPSVPQVYIYDYTQSSAPPQSDLINLHLRLYNSGQVPMFFVVTKRNVIIFNCFERPAEDRTLAYKPLTIISLAASMVEYLDNRDNEDLEKFKAFSAKGFDNGSFWEDSPFKDKFRFADSAYEKLLSELKQALKDIIEKKILVAEVARKIMVSAILIKYLEERTDDYNNSVFPKAGEERTCIINGKRQKKRFDKSFFDQFSTGADCFTDILKTPGACVKLLDYLSSHFNGGVFLLTDIERESLDNCDLGRFASFLEGNLEGVQYVFWKLYSFNDLPVELISNIYEEFLEKRAGVVYTPPYLVNFLLDESMPFKDSQTDFKILDPACGSGVFLVGAYRRLIYRWRKSNGWKNPPLNTLKSLLKKNIYGADKDRDAVNLSIFSLSLALCDELAPLEIWENLEFDNLHQQNIFDQDFFLLKENKTFLLGTFDLIIGNPPFESVLTAAAKRIEVREARARTISTIIDDKEKITSVRLPDNQIALLFLEQSIDLCKDGKLVCLIQPTGPFLYNNTSLDFRKFLMERNNVAQIIDFTHINRILFGENGDVATAAVFIKKEKPKEKPLLHITVRRTKMHKEKLYFDIDSYDFHYIPRKLALNDGVIWKANLLGGNRFHQLISRFSKVTTLKQFLDAKLGSWHCSEGFTNATKKDLQKLSQLEEDAHKSKEAGEKYVKFANRLQAPFLTGAKYLPSDAFTVAGIEKTKITPALFQKYFHSKGTKQVYEGPHIIIKEAIIENKIPVALHEEYLTFGHRMIGIHAPQKDIEQLKWLFNRLSNPQFNILYLAGTSAEFMVNRSSSILKKDFDNFLVPTLAEELNLSNHEKILYNDFWNFLIEFRRKGEKSKIATNNVTENELEHFARTFCEVLGSVYPSLKAHKPFETTSHICFPFYFKNKPTIEFGNKDKAEQDIIKLVYKISGVSLRLTRVVRLYEGNVIYLIKPKKLRYWLGSVALRDADETFVDLRKQGF